MFASLVRSGWVGAAERQRGPSPPTHRAAARRSPLAVGGGVIRGRRFAYFVLRKITNGVYEAGVGTAPPPLASHLPAAGAGVRLVPLGLGASKLSGWPRRLWSLADFRPRFRVSGRFRSRLTAMQTTRVGPCVPVGVQLAVGRHGVCLTLSRWLLTDPSATWGSAAPPPQITRHRMR
jgi:hypothetical protein